MRSEILGSTKRCSVCGGYYTTDGNISCPHCNLEYKIDVEELKQRLLQQNKEE